MCVLKHVEEVEDGSSTPMGCNAMYVGDVEDGYVRDVEDIETCSCS